jgi:hypothetical protein
MDRSASRTKAITAWAVAVVCWLAQLAAFWPGMLSRDAAFMWWQARGGTLDTVHSPLLIFVWRGLLWLGDSPWPIFVLHTGMFWAALGLIATRLPWRAWQAAVFVVLAGLSPPLWVLFSQVGTDAALAAALAFAAACLLCARDGARGWYAPAALSLCYAGAMRLNAWPALLPIMWLLAAALPGSRVPWRRGGWMALLLAAMLLAVGTINALAPRQVAVWPATAMWDLAAISIAEDRVLLPPGSIGPGMTVDDLAQAFRPWTNTTLFAQTRAGVRQPFLGPQQAELKRTIALAWWRAVRDHPMAYARHRLRTMRALLGTRPQAWPRELAYVPGETQLADNPPLPVRHDAWHRFWMQRFEHWRSTAWLAAWPWLLLYVPALLFAWRERRTAQGGLALALVTSGVLYALPLCVAAPGAELRYLGWSFAAAWLAFGVAVGGHSESVHR